MTHQEFADTALTRRIFAESVSYGLFQVSNITVGCKVRS